MNQFRRRPHAKRYEQIGRWCVKHIDTLAMVGFNDYSLWNTSEAGLFTGSGHKPARLIKALSEITARFNHAHV